MPTIQVISPREVRVDGANIGTVADAIANSPAFAPAIQQGLIALFDERATALDAAVALAKADGAAKVAEAEAKHLEAHQARVKADAEVADVRALAASVIGKARAALADGGLSEAERVALLAECVEEAAQPAIERERDAIARQVSELQARLAQLGGGETKV